jgi:hypothetical protein
MRNFGKRKVKYAKVQAKPVEQEVARESKSCGHCQKRRPVVSSNVARAWDELCGECFGNVRAIKIVSVQPTKAAVKGSVETQKETAMRSKKNAKPSPKLEALKEKRVAEATKVFKGDAASSKELHKDIDQAIAVVEKKPSSRKSPGKKGAPVRDVAAKEKAHDKVVGVQGIKTGRTEIPVKANQYVYKIGKNFGLYDTSEHRRVLWFSGDKAELERGKGKSKSKAA